MLLQELPKQAQLSEAETIGKDIFPLPYATFLIDERGRYDAHLMLKYGGQLQLFSPIDNRSHLDRSVVKSTAVVIHYTDLLNILTRHIQ